MYIAKRSFHQYTPFPHA